MPSKFHCKLQRRVNSTLGPIYAAQHRNSKNTSIWQWYVSHDDDLPILSKNRSFFEDRKLDFIPHGQDYRIVDIVRDPCDEDLDHPILFSIISAYQAR